MNSEKPHPDQSAERFPFVSVVLPIRNEQTFIGRTLQGILSQDYPADRMEIIVADGMSDDQTRSIVKDFAKRHPQIKMVDNPGRVTPSGLNVAIAAAKGEIISRVDGHCEVAADFVRQNVQLLHEHPEAWAVGGPVVHCGRTLFAKAAAIASAHPAGVGMARHRFPTFEGYVDTATFPAFRSWIFQRIGIFDENLVRTEDDEFNYRIVQAGGKIFVSPRVRYIYYVRDRLDQLFRQYFQYSFWRIPVIRKHKTPTTVRQIVPVLFFTGMLMLSITGIWLRQPILTFTLPAIYAAALLLVAITVIPKNGLLVASMVPVAMAAMHISYALGIAYGAWATAFRPNAWKRSGHMSALSR
jgi:succinoglycan biosynthesis protein ExoA